LRLSLVTCPIELFPATSQAEKTHFHQINTQTGHRLRQQMVDEETGRAVDAAHKGRGYELTRGKYVEIDEDELTAIRVESTGVRKRGAKHARPEDTETCQTAGITEQKRAGSKAACQ
jgi:non-homologous end joining protein Ku